LAGLLYAGLSVGARPADAQPTPRDSTAAGVQAVIDQLFDGMRAGDSTAVRAALHTDARLFTATGDGLRGGDVDGFVTAVGSPRDAVWDEQTFDVEIRVDGPLAAAWVPYVFYRGNTLSHCGVNAVQVARTEGRWMIVQLVDTRRSDCPDVRE